MNAHQILVVLALGVFLGLGSAHAQPVVYDSTAGPGETKRLNIGIGSLDLYIDLGVGETQSGTICENGNGDELCAADVEITLTGPGEIVGFGFAPPPTDPDVPNVIYEPYEPADFPTSKIRLNLLQSVSPPPPSPPIPEYLGTVSVDIFSSASPGNPVRVVAIGQAVNAGGNLIGIPSVEIAEAPEPSGIVLLLSGALGIAALHQLRTRGSSVVASGGR